MPQPPTRTVSPATAAAVPTACFPGVQPGADGAPVLDAEKLLVYHLALELQLLCAQLVPADHRVLHDQLERASLSAVLNLAEGAERRSRKDKRRHCAYARGSAMECAAAVDVLRVRGLASPDACRTARSLALRVVQMLTKLDAALA